MNPETYKRIRAVGDALGFSRLAMVAGAGIALATLAVNLPMGGMELADWAWAGGFALIGLGGWGLNQAALRKDAALRKEFGVEERNAT